MSLLRRLTFQLWYFGKPPWDSGITPPELQEFIAQHKPGRAIDLGCGTGTNVIALARAGWQVTGIDFASRAIQIAKRKTRNAGVAATLLVGDVTKLNLSEQFDLALDIGCFHGVEDRAAYLDQLTRLLAPNGFWLMYGFFSPAPSTCSPSGDFAGLRPHRAGPGLAEADVDMASARGLTLISRKDGFDKKERPSAWFLFQKP